MANIKHIRPVDKNGLRHGEWIGYYDNGKLWYSDNYVHNVSHGLQEGYYSDGTLMYRGNYNMGREIGYWYYEFKPKEYYLCLI